MKLPMPNAMTSDEIMELLMREEYGQLPSAPISVTAEEDAPPTGAKRFCAGKASLQKFNLVCQAAFGTFTFPVYYVCPKGKTDIPCMVVISFRSPLGERYQPIEEIVDAGFATLSFSYGDVTSDNGDFTNGLAGVLYPDGKRPAGDSCGKIAMWAWAAMRVMDFAMTRPELDHGRIGVVGHSRLGKTALLTGALDHRFYCAFSNDSGCSGAALSRENTGETIAKICENFPYWFCENYKQYADNEDALPFDQHFLIAANFPHRVYVASAAGDAWACPPNEYRACLAASSYYEERKLSGFVAPASLPEIGECFHDGHIAYHIRAGEHYLSREDWKYYLEYMKK